MAEVGVGGDSAAQDYAVDAMFLHGVHGSADHGVNYGFLEGEGDFGDVRGVEVAVFRGRVHSLEFGAAEDGGFESAEAEVEGVSYPGARQVGFESDGAFGDSLDFGAAGKAESEDASCLVEGFSGGVVAGSAYECVNAVPLHEDQVGVSAGCYEAHEGEAGAGFGVNAVLEPGGVHVAFEVVYADEGEVVGKGEALGGVDADEQRAGESGAVGDGYAVEFGEFEAGLFEGGVHDGEQGSHVFAGGDFGDYAAVAGVHFDLGGDYVGDDVSSVLDDGGGGFVAGCFDSEDFHIYMPLSEGARGR